MVEIRHRSAYKSSNDFWSIPTQDNPRTKKKAFSSNHKKKSSSIFSSLFDVQIPIWFVLLIAVVFLLANHHQKKQDLQINHEYMLHEERERHSSSKNTNYFRRNSRAKGDDEDEVDVSKLESPQEDEYWVKQEEKLRKEREEFELQRKKEEEELQHEREELQHERDEFQQKGQKKKKPIISYEAFTTQLLEKHKDDPDHWITYCLQRVRQQYTKSDSSNEQERMSFLYECASEKVSNSLVELNKGVSLQARERQSVAGLLENYTCTNPDAPASPDLYPAHNWTSPHPLRYHDPPTIRVHVKHDRHASRVHVLENFIDEEECQAMEDAARSKLHVATTANGKGGSQVSDARKAMQAGIHVPWDKEKEGNPIARLSRRVYDYTNHVLGFEIDEHGQEDLMSIQYEGHGFIHNPDRYTPHCDGDCTGSPFRPGTRMATIVMYCTIPTLGGATNFRNSNVHIKAKAGSAVFFSYIDPLTNMTDSRFTEHSGCPVYEGSKKIVTQWIRLGVSQKDPWNSFNTLGIKYSVASKYE